MIDDPTTLIDHSDVELTSMRQTCIVQDKKQDICVCICVTDDEKGERGGRRDFLLEIFMNHSPFACTCRLGCRGRRGRTHLGTRRTPAVGHIFFVDRRQSRRAGRVRTGDEAATTRN